MMGNDHRAGLVVMLIALIAFAGCVEAMDRMQEATQPSSRTEQERSDPGMTAMEAHQLAKDDANDWHPGAKLTMAATIEKANTHQLGVMMGLPSADTANLEPDPNVGDGLSPQWSLYYATPDRDEGAVFLVESDQDVTRVHEADEVPGDRSITADRWRIDSDEALAAIEDDAELREHLDEEDPNQMVWTLVFQDEPGHLWQAWIQGLTEGPRGEPATGPVFVNATTGEREKPHQRDMEPIQDEGRLSAQERTVDHAIKVDQAATVEADLSWYPDDAETSPRVNLSLLQDGAQVEPEERSDDGSHIHLLFEDLEPGEYRLRITLEEGAPEDGEVRFTLGGMILYAREA